MINRRVEGGISIDVSAQPLDVAGDRTHVSAIGTLEEHMLMEMGETFFARPLVGGTDIGPDLQLDDRRAVALSEQDRQSVVENLLEGRFRNRVVVGDGLIQSAPRVTEGMALRPLGVRPYRSRALGSAYAQIGTRLRGLRPL